MDLEFEATVFTWRGPAPYYFVRVPDDEGALIAETAAFVTYGWGMVPVTAQVGDTEWTTSLWPKDGSYVLPLKVWVRRDEAIDEGQELSVRLTIAV